MTRPYSQNELRYLEKDCLTKLRVGQYTVRHEDCGHFYRATAKGEKEKNWIAHREAGNCSVCWKLGTLRDAEKINANHLVRLYTFVDPTNIFPPKSKDYLDLVVQFYTWLYGK